MQILLDVCPVRHLPNITKKWMCVGWRAMWFESICKPLWDNKISSLFTFWFSDASIYKYLETEVVFKTVHLSGILFLIFMDSLSVFHHFLYETGILKFNNPRKNTVAPLQYQFSVLLSLHCYIDGGFCFCLGVHMWLNMCTCTLQ